MSDLQIPFSSLPRLIHFFQSGAVFVCWWVSPFNELLSAGSDRGLFLASIRHFPPTLQAFIPRLFLESVTRPASPFPLFPSVESLLLKPLVVFWPKIQVAFQLYHTCSLSQSTCLQQGGIKECFLLLAPRQTE